MYHLFQDAIQGPLMTVCKMSTKCANCMSGPSLKSKLGSLKLHTLVLCFWHQVESTLSVMVAHAVVWQGRAASALRQLTAGAIS